MSQRSPARRPVAVLAFTAALLVSAVVLFTPGNAVPTGPWWSDEAVHVVVFALLAATGSALPLPPAPLAAGMACYAAFSEVVQALAVPRRSGSLTDLLADLAGIAVGLALAASRGSGDR